jgi:hypothetical protein
MIRDSNEEFILLRCNDSDGASYQSVLLDPAQAVKAATALLIWANERIDTADGLYR